MASVAQIEGKPGELPFFTFFQTVLLIEVLESKGLRNSTAYQVAKRLSGDQRHVAGFKSQKTFQVSIYNQLRKLKDQGFIVAYPMGDHQPYGVTRKGREALELHIDALELHINDLETLLGRCQKIKPLLAN